MARLRPQDRVPVRVVGVGVRLLGERLDEQFVTGIVRVGDQAVILDVAGTGLSQPIADGIVGEGVMS